MDLSCVVEVHSLATGMKMDLPLQRGKSILTLVGKLTVVYKNEILSPESIPHFIHLLHLDLAQQREISGFSDGRIWV